MEKFNKGNFYVIILCVCCVVSMHVCAGPLCIHAYVCVCVHALVYIHESISIVSVCCNLTAGS